MARERQIKIVFAGDARSLERAMGLVDKRAGSLDQKLIRTGGTLTRRLTLPIVAMGGAAVKAFSDFDDAMTQSTAIMGDLSESMRTDLEETAREVAKTTTFSAKEAADAYFFLASAGLDAAESLEAMPKVAQFAQAGMFDMARATDLLTDAQSALGLKTEDAQQNLSNMERVSDVFVKANTLANTSVEQIADAMTNKVGAASRALKKDVEETSAVLSAFADQGVKGAAAGNALNIVWRDLTTKARTNTAAFEEFNVSVFDSEGAMRNTADIIGDLERALAGMSVEQQRATLSQLGFQDRSVAFIVSLLGTSDAIRGYESALRDAGGITEEVANKQLESFAAQLNMAKGRVMDAAISIGGSLAPTVKALADTIVFAVEGFSRLPDPIKATAGAVVILAAAAGPAMIITGRLMQAWRLLNAQLLAGQAAAALAGKQIGTLHAGAMVATRSIRALSLAVAKIALPITAVVAGFEAFNAITHDTERELQDLRRSAADLRLQLLQGEMSVLDFEEAMGAMGAETVNSLDGLREFERQLERGEKAVSGAAKAMRAANDPEMIRFERFAKQYESVNQAAGEAQETIERLDDAQRHFAQSSDKEMKDWRESMVESLTPTSEAFGELADKADLAIQDIHGGLQELIEAQKELRENWKTVAGVLGDDTDDIARFLSEKMGIDVPTAMAVLASSSDDEIQKIRRQYTRWMRQATRTENVVGGALGGVKGKTKDVGDEADTAAGKVDKLYDALKKIGGLADMKFSLRVDVPDAAAGDFPFGVGVGGRAGSAAAMAAQAMAAVSGTQFVSGYRTPERNRQVGGSPTSLHMDRNNPAQDISGANLMGIARYLLQFGPSLRELIYTPLGFSVKNGRVIPPVAAASHKTHVHVADRGGRFRGPGLVGIGNIDEFVFQPARKVSNQTPSGDTFNITVYAGSMTDERRVAREIDRVLEKRRRRDSRIERSQLQTL